MVMGLIGRAASVPTDVRIITATHRDLTTLVAEGRFREDLLYRINVIEVRVIQLEDLPDGLREQPSSNACPAEGRLLADVAREHIVRTMCAAAGNKTAAARMLGLDRKTLYRKLAQHRIATR
jgi:transcriptional regulator of acetoin/glycerol metabolism